MLRISEIFYSLQGEGLTIGVPSVFIRLGKCNLICGGKNTIKDKGLHNGATWRCDTIEVWKKSKGIKYENILSKDQIKALKNGSHLIFTGGEPLLHQDNIIEYIEYLHKINIKPFIEIETNGTIKPKDKLKELINLFNVSPKLSNSGNSINKIYKEEVIKDLIKSNSIFKFVINNNLDFDELINLYQIIFKHKRQSIYLMPAGSDKNELMKTKILVADLCKKHYLKMTNRMHIEIWNKKTGV